MSADRIREVCESYSAVLGAPVWQRRDCLTLVDDMLAAVGAGGTVRAGPPLEHPTLQRSVVSVKQAHGTLRAYYVSVLDAHPLLRRRGEEEPRAPGDILLTPQEGTFYMDNHLVDAADLHGAQIGVVDHENYPVILRHSGGLARVSETETLWCLSSPR